MLKDIEHLIRLCAVMLVALLLFLVLRVAVVPKSFGQYGHYRANAISEIASRTPAFAGHGVCEGCHTEVVDQKKLGRHVNVPCETCHGPQGKHAEDPASLKPQLPDTGVICARCHEANSAKPKGFPQVVSSDHSGGLACNTCHKPHRPRIEDEQKTASAKRTGGKK